MMNDEQKQALIERLNKLAEGLKWHNVAYSQDVLAAVAALTQPASPAFKLPDVQEQVIGVWNPSANEIAVRKLSGIKVVDFAHWHCHCTKEVVVRDISDHPAILNAPHTAPIEPICATGGAEWSGNSLANDALIMLDRIDTSDSADDDRIEEVKRIVRLLAAAPEEQDGD